MDQSEEFNTLREVDLRIAELQERVRILQTSRSQLATKMCNDVLNSAAACDRDCCGSTPRQLAFSPMKCEKSPIGTCVFSHRRDPDHVNCLFCHKSEE